MAILSELELALVNSWSKETSLDPDNWAPANSALGQCAVTALIINDYLGGELVWAEVSLPNGEKISHYFNLINKKEIDLTRKQFPKGAKIPKGISKKKNFSTTREYVLSHSETQKRYEKIKKEVQKYFNFKR